MRYRLRIHGTEIELRFGTTVLGRGPTCNMVIDDPLVSREHAELRVTDDGVTITDLESANGVLVNGERIERAQLLGAGDLILVGGHQLQLVADTRGSDQKLQTTLPGVTPTRPQGSALDSTWDDEEDDDLGMRTKPVTQFQLVAGAVEQLLMRGRQQRAEALLEPQLHQLLDRAQRGDRLPDADWELLDRVARRMVQTTGHPRWLDFLFDLGRHTGRLLPLSTIDQLDELLRTTRGADRARLRTYVDELVAKKDALSATDQNALSRLMAVERQLDEEGS